VAYNSKYLKECKHCFKDIQLFFNLLFLTPEDLKINGGKKANNSRVL